MERLKSKAYGDAPLNVNETVWQAILDKERVGAKGVRESELELEEGDGLAMTDDMTDEDEEGDWDEDEGEQELENGEEDWGDREFVSDLSGDDSEDGLSDLEEAAVSITFCLSFFVYISDADFFFWCCRVRTQSNSQILRKTRMRMRKITSPSPHRKRKHCLGSEKYHHTHQKPCLAHDQKRRPKVRSFPDIPSTLLTYPPCIEGPRVEVEYEHEMESVPLTKVTLANW